MYINTCCTLYVIDENAYNRLITKPQLIGVKNLAWSYQSESPIYFLGEFWCKLKCKSTVEDA